MRIKMKKTCLIWGIFLWVGSIVLSYLFIDKPLADFIFAHHFREYLAPLTHTVEWAPIMNGVAPFFGVGLLAAIVKKKEKTPLWVRIFFFMILSVMLTFLLKNELKWVFSRYWTETWIDHNLSWIQNRAYGFQWFQGKLLQGDDAMGSFPSGHTATAFATFLSLGFCYRRWLWTCVILASLEGIFMVLFDYHFLSDVLAGALVGTACTLLYFHLIFNTKENKALLMMALR